MPHTIIGNSKIAGVARNLLNEELGQTIHKSLPQEEEMKKLIANTDINQPTKEEMHKVGCTCNGREHGSVPFGRVPLIVCTGLCNYLERCLLYQKTCTLKRL